MRKPSRIATLGGFSSIGAIRQLGDAYLTCTFCGTQVDARGWVHVASQRVVCRACMADPHGDDGEAGRRMAERLAELVQFERELEEITIL